MYSWCSKGCGLYVVNQGLLMISWQEQELEVRPYLTFELQPWGVPVLSGGHTGLAGGVNKMLWDPRDTLWFFGKLFWFVQ